jgi:hypothetical protein
MDECHSGILQLRYYLFAFKMYTLTRLNDEVIKPLPVYHPNPNQILGYDIIPMLYSNVFVSGRKGSGKTNIINHLIKHCTSRETTLIIFSATHNSDANWLEIKKWLEARKQPSLFYLNISDGKTSHINDLMQLIQEEDAAAEQEKKKPKQSKAEIIKFNNSDSDEDENGGRLNQTTKSRAKQGPKYMFIFDDISAELKQKGVAVLLKHLRHYKSKVIISSQYPNDIDRAARVQIDFWCLFKGFEPIKMEEVFPQLDVNGLDFDGFYSIYKGVTRVPHNFLYVNKGENELRQNFNQKINFEQH